MDNEQASSKGRKWNPRSVSSEELIKLIALRNQTAMHELFDRHETQVYRFALRLGRDAALAEDVTAETFCHVWRDAAARFKGHAQVPTWLIAIARNLLINVMRRSSAQQLDQSMADSIEDLADTPEVTAAKMRQNRIVSCCVSCLPPKQRAPIELFYFQDKTIREVAEIVGIPINTVKSRLLRGRELLVELLKHFEIERADSMAYGSVGNFRAFAPVSCFAERWDGKQEHDPAAHALLAELHPSS